MSADSLKNKVILVTGATGVLGRHFVRDLFDAGAKVVISDLSLSKCEALKKKMVRRPADAKNILARELDITDPDSVDAALKKILGKYKRIDGLVNNAVCFIPADQTFFNRKLEDFKKATDVNVNGVFLITQHVAKIMKKQKSGVIVNLGSIYGMFGNDQNLYPSGHANYDYHCFHKGGVVNFTRFLAAYLGKYNIRVNALSPGFVSAGALNRRTLKKYLERTPIGRVSRPEEVSNALIFLLSDDSSYITGHNLVVDGGRTAI